MGVIAYIGDRPGEWDLPLFLHVLGAMVLVGSVVLTLIFLVSAARGHTGALRIALRSMLLGVLPGYLVMRIAAEWIADKEGLTDADLAWIGIGYGVADAGLLMLIVAAVAAWLARRRGGTGIGVQVAIFFIGLLLVADLVAIWAMTTKPV